MRFPRVRGREAEVEAARREEMAEVARLQRDLHRARARYEAALAELEGRAAGLNGGAAQPAGVMTAEREGDVSLGSASFQELRDLGLSVTQATRVLDRRDRGVVRSVDDLESVPGIPHAKLDQLRRRLRD